jgi:hypothetical protein
MGDVRRVRVYYDGVEMTGMDPRGQAVLDLTQINLWAVEDAVIEPTADEVRVYLRSWRVRNTTPETRTDVSTGDQQTNLYRAFFGKRFDNGGGIQFGAQQYGTTPPSIFGTSSDQTSIVGRLGWAKQDWSVDAVGTRISRHRGSIFGETANGFVGAETGDSIPTVESPIATRMKVHGGRRSWRWRRSTAIQEFARCRRSASRPPSIRRAPLRRSTRAYFDRSTSRPRESSADRCA